MQIKPLLRFWPSIVGGWVFSVCAIIAVGNSSQYDVPPPIFNLGFLFASFVFVCLSITITIFLEQRKWNQHRFVQFAQLIALICAGLMYWFVVTTLNVSPPAPSTVFRIGLILATSFYSLFFLPFVFCPPTNEDYWNWLMKTLKQFLFTFFSTGAIFVSIQILISVLLILFQVNFPSGVLPYVFFFIFGCVSLPVFLFGFPITKHSSDEQSTLWLRGLSAFAKYVALPIVSVYFFVLYAYGAKILWLQELPHGVTGILSLCFLGLGWGVYLLSFPLWSTAKRSTYSYWFGKFFWAGVIPVAILLLVAIGIRIQGFGFTPMRILVLLIGLWFLATAIVHQMRPKISFVVMPCVLILVLILFALSPFASTF